MATNLYSREITLVIKVEASGKAEAREIASELAMEALKSLPTGVSYKPGSLGKIKLI